MKYHIEKNTVQETLVIPLFGRLVCSERFPELFSDPEAKRICDSLDYDFADKRKKMESAAGLFGALEEAPSHLKSVSLGVRGASGESWYSAFPVSGVEDDGDRGFSALLDEIPADAEVCVVMRGDTTVKSDWTSVKDAINSDTNDK